MIVAIAHQVTMLVAARSPVTDPGFHDQVALALDRVAIDIWCEVAIKRMRYSG
jgi:hypothetical protein